MPRGSRPGTAAGRTAAEAVRSIRARARAAPVPPPDPLITGIYAWAVEHNGRCIGSAALSVDPDPHRARHSVGLFVAALRGQGLGREVTRLAPDRQRAP
jgi:hypothetical protein